MDISKVQTSTTLPGLGYLPVAEKTLTINSFVLGASSASSVFTLSLPISVVDAATLLRVKFSGTGNTDVENQWIMVYGSMFFLSSYGDTALTVKRTAGNVVINVQFYNGALASKTIPTQTVDCRVFPYTAPWD